MPLETLEIRLTPKTVTKGLDAIRQMTSITTIGIDSSNRFPPAEFWKKYDAGEFGKPAVPANLAYLDPAFQQWVTETQALPAEQQIEAVSKKLMELNPGFDGKVTIASGNGTPKIESGMVTEIGFFMDHVADILPVRLFAGLKALSCNGSGRTTSKLSDISPLEGMQLLSVNLGGIKVSDLSPLRGMHLRYLHCGYTQVSDLSSLEGMKLDNLLCHNTPISDLSPLQGMSLNDLRFTPSNITKGLNIIRQMKSLETIGTSLTENLAAADFWKRYDAGEFGKSEAKAESGKRKAGRLAYLDPAFQQWVKATQALSAEQQIEAVSKKLMELNPGFDGKIRGWSGGGGPKIEGNVVTELGLVAGELGGPIACACLAGITKTALHWLRRAEIQHIRLIAAGRHGTHSP